MLAVLVITKGCTVRLQGQQLHVHVALHMHGHSTHAEVHGATPMPAGQIQSMNTHGCQAWQHAGVQPAATSL